MPIEVAFGYFMDTPKYMGWVTKGWYTLGPGEKVTVIGEPLDNEYYYYYASSADSTIEFKGEILLKVGDGNFQIKDANSEISLKNDHYRFFRQIDTADRKKFKVVLHENFVEEK